MNERGQFSDDEKVRLERPEAPAPIGRLVGHGVVSIQGNGWETTPGWIGPLRFWKARRYAKRNGITLVDDCDCWEAIDD